MDEDRHPLLDYLARLPYQSPVNKTRGGYPLYVWADDNGFGRVSLYRLVHGESSPRIETLQRIEERTHGRVKIKAMMDWIIRHQERERNERRATIDDGRA